MLRRDTFEHASVWGTNGQGRPERYTLLLLSVFPIATWTAIYFSRTGFTLMIARFFAGVWTGGCYTVRPNYVSEIAEPRVRGIAGTLLMVSAFAGTIFCFIIGPYVSMQTNAVINGLFPPVFIILFLFCPESPYYYVMRGRHGDARKSLAWLRGGASVEDELSIIRRSIEKETRAGQGYFAKICSLFTMSANRKAFFIVEIMSIFQRICGLSYLAAYLTVILPEKIGPLTADHCTLIVGVEWLLSSLGCSLLVDRLGRKPLLYLSSVGIFASMISTGIWYYLDKKTSTDVTGVNWVPFAGILVFGATLNLGLGSIAPMYMSEMFPSNLKAQASGLTCMVSAASSFVSVAVFATLNIYVGLYANFLIFALVGLINWIFTYLYVIETKGKSLQMIQEELNGENRENFDE